MKKTPSSQLAEYIAHLSQFTTTKHTPGDWHLGRRAAHTAIFGPRGEEIAVILETLDPEENLANARLIAAAPELLAALADCITDDGAMACRNAEFAGRRLEAISQIARAAIAKATGNL